jgi:hypothetical protein
MAKARQSEEPAIKVRCPERREWQMIFARAYRMLAESEVEIATRRTHAA